MQTLVSIAVVTYNSARTVLDTLNSIKMQTYPHIELIISDDCSIDNTVELCRTWIESNHERFVRTEIIIVEKNTGVAGNVNRAVDACHAKWVKTIAGDDVLMPDCVKVYVEFAENHSNMVYAFSKIQAFGSSKENCARVENLFNYRLFEWPASQQYEYLMENGNCIPAATGFFNKEKLRKLGLRFDERIPLLDDYPMWLNLLKNGVHLDFIDIVTTKYRVSENSLSTALTKSTKYSKSEMLMYKYYRFPYFYQYGNKKEAVLKLLQAEKYIHDNAFIWRMIVYIYKKLTGINNRSTIK